MNEKDKENLKRNEHISDETLLQDIKDTEREIKEYENKIKPRREFINKLQYLLNLRHPIQQIED